jgi:hypothetical protein
MTETELNVMAALAIMGLSQHTKERIKDTRRNRNTHSAVYECQKQVLSYVPHDCRAQGPSALNCLAGVFGHWKKQSEAKALHRELIDRASRGHVPSAHQPPFILWARHFPQYRALRSDPGFALILREMDSPEEKDVDRS